MVADEPVDPDLLAQLLEISPGRVEELCAELAAIYDAEDRGFVLARVAGGYRFQSHPDLAPYVERFVLEGQSSKLSVGRPGDARHRRLQAAGVPGPGRGHPGRQRRRRDPDPGPAGLHRRGGRDPGPGQAVLYGTTSLFLERLGLDSLDELQPGPVRPGGDVVRRSSGCPDPDGDLVEPRACSPSLRR